MVLQWDNRHRLKEIVMYTYKFKRYEEGYPRNEWLVPCHLQQAATNKFSGLIKDMNLQIYILKWHYALQ